MAVARIASRTQLGLHAPLVHVEVHLGAGLPTFNIVGLPATAVKESKERVRAALVNSSFEFPAGRITVNLAPADIPKEGGRFDLPIALGILLASEQLKPAGESNALDAQEFYGELALSGELKPVRGLLLAAVRAASEGHAIIVPRANVQEASVASSGVVHGADHLIEVCEHVRGAKPLPPPGERPALTRSLPSARLDIADIRGQLQAKRALVVAAAGGHSLLMVGPPGTGKTMLAQRLPGLLPPLTEPEALEVAAVASVSAFGFDLRRFGERPFRAPHHTASAQSIVGGGPRALPGEASLAHHGVLFLDELPEFERRVLEALREPLESGTLSISRAALKMEYPAQFQLIAAMNPCPCGYYGDARGDCNCTPPQLAAYRARVSGPLLDRIDLRIVVPALQRHELLEQGPSREGTAELAERVGEARRRQLARAGKLNSRLTAREVEACCVLDAACTRLLCESESRLRLSARSYHRILRVARTIADLQDSPNIQVEHLAEALQLKRAME